MVRPYPVDKQVFSRQAFLAGWWGGILVGMVLGAGLVVLALHAFGRLP